MKKPSVKRILHHLCKYAHVLQIMQTHAWQTSRAAAMCKFIPGLIRFALKREIDEIALAMYG
jgi:hypothetical protein